MEKEKVIQKGSYWCNPGTLPLDDNRKKAGPRGDPERELMLKFRLFGVPPLSDVQFVV